MSIERLVYFGDSLTDSDEFWRLSRPLLKRPLPDPDWYARQYSDGEVHADVTPGLLGIEGGTAYNYAVAGARAVGTREAREFVTDPDWLKVPLDDPRLDLDVNFGAQVRRMLSDTASRDWDVSRFAAHVWIGLNDLAAWAPESVFPWRWPGEVADLVDDIVGSVADGATELARAGFGKVWIASLPEASFFPAFNDAGWLSRYFGGDVVSEINAGFDAVVAELRAEGHEAAVIDIHAMTGEIEADPSNFGFASLEEPLLLVDTAAYDPPRNTDVPADYDPERLAFVDKVHPSATMHRLLAIFEAEVMATRLVAPSGRTDAIDGSGGEELILAGAGDDRIGARGAADVVFGGTGSDEIDGGGGSDLLSGGSGRDTLDGGSGLDFLSGGLGDDETRGGGGRDLLIETGGSDTMFGGSGDDTFLWFDAGLSPGGSAGADRLDGGVGSDAAIFYLSSRATLDAVLEEYGDGSGSGAELPSIGVEAVRIESLDFVLVRDADADLPDLTSATLALRLGEAEDWGLV
jgi:hypothetical protein